MFNQTEEKVVYRVEADILYRDAGNYKTRQTFSYATNLDYETLETLIEMLGKTLSSEEFVMEDLGLDPVRCSRDLDDDHCFHEFSDFSIVSDENKDIYAQKGVGTFEEMSTVFMKKDKENSWNVFAIEEGYQGKGYIAPAPEEVQELIKTVREKMEEAAIETESNESPSV